MNYASLVSLILMINIGGSQIDPGTSGVTNENGILVFRSFDHLEKVISDIEALQAGIESKIAEKCDQSSSLGRPQTEDALDDCTSQFRDQDGSAFAEFEDGLGFKSLRRILEYQRTEYLKSESSDVSPDKEPGTHFIGRPQDQAVLNSLAQVKIGDKYHQLTETEHLIFNSREELDKACTSSSAQIDIFAGKSRRLQSAFCRTNVFSFGYYICPNVKYRRIRWVVGHYWWFFSYRTYAYTSCQRRLFFSWWWFPTFTVNLARSWGRVSNPIIVGCSIQNNTCRSMYTFNTLFSTNFSQGWGFFRTHTVCVPTKTASGWVRGQHQSKCCPGVNFLSTLFILQCLDRAGRISDPARCVLRDGRCAASSG